MGTHISKVKSADLDTWTPEQVENMHRWGNAKANAYWEYSWKGGDPPEATIEQWIRSKYELKKYAMKGPVPDPSTIVSGLEASYVTSSISSTTSHSASSQHQTKQTAVSAPFAAFTAFQTSTSHNTSASPQKLFNAFQAPVSAVAPVSHSAQKDIKNDIMSLFANVPSGTVKSEVVQQPQINNTQKAAYSDNSAKNDLFSLDWPGAAPHLPTSTPTAVDQAKNIAQASTIELKSNFAQKFAEMSVSPADSAPTYSVNSPSVTFQWAKSGMLELESTSNKNNPLKSYNITGNTATLESTSDFSQSWGSSTNAAAKSASTQKNLFEIPAPRTNWNAPVSTQPVTSWNSDGSLSINPPLDDITANAWGGETCPQNENPLDFGDFSGGLSSTLSTAPPPVINDEWSGFQ